MDPNTPAPANPTSPNPTAAQPAMTQPYSAAPKNNKKLMMIVGALVVLLLIVIAAAFILSNNTNEPSDDTKPSTSNSAGDIVSSKPSTDSSPFPEITVAQWDMSQATVTDGALSGKVYDFIEPTEATFQSMATSIIPGVSLETEEDEDRFVAHPNTQDTDMMLYMQKGQGHFLFKAVGDGGPALPTPTQNEQLNVESYLQKLLADKSIDVSASYQKSHVEGVTYYEAHRSWTSVGLPILNTVGVFNLPDSLSLNAISYVPNAAVLALLGEDPNIIKTTDSADGKLRQNEFNTVTVGVKDGKIVSILSNMRITNPVRPSSDVNFVSSATAIERLTSGQYTQILTSPAGTGNLDTKKIYPNNKAQLKIAKVDEGRLVYLEEIQGAQRQLLPYYIFRGSGQLDSGYDVKFLASVAASDVSVLGINQSQQQGTITFPSDPASSSAKTGSPPNTTSTGRINSPSTRCYEGVDPDDNWPHRNELSNVQSDASGNEYGQYAGKKGLNDGLNLWYVSLKTKTLAALDNTIDYAASTIGLAHRGTSLAGQFKDEDDDKGRVLRTMSKIQKDFDRTSGDCPIRLTGSSPTMFISSDRPTAFTVAVDTRLTYAQPGQSNNAWSIDYQNNLKVNGEKVPYIYYEYAPLRWDKPSTGWSTSQTQLPQLSQRIARQLGLTSTEQDRLLFELEHAASGVDESALYVGLIPQNQVDKQLPLSLGKKADHVYRYHFYVAASRGAMQRQPVLSPITRDGLTILELGASAQ